MAGLQRFITYIYKYEKDQKTGNAGFAKIEIRGTVCRVEVHIRNSNIEPEEITVYLFARDAEGMQGILLGNIAVSRGNGDVRYTFETKELTHFGTSMEQMEGIFIPIDAETYLASQWKEGVLERNRFHVLEKKTPQEDKKETDSTPTPEEQDADGRTADAKQPERIEQPEQAEQPERMEQPEQIERRERVEQPQRMEQQKQAEQPERMEQQKQAEQPQRTEQQKQAEQLEHREPQENDRNPIHTTELPLENFMEEADWEKIFGKLRLKRNIVFPFEGKKVECVRMKLDDIKEFPRKYWYIGNNSFLLHGFFNYKHIIFGEMEEDGTKEYFIGVPGVFQNPERIMAAMFGFPEFRTVKSAEHKTGNFGYWYRII